MASAPVSAAFAAFNRIFHKSKAPQPPASTDDDHQPDMATPDFDYFPPLFPDQFDFPSTESYITWSPETQSRQHQIVGSRLSISTRCSR